MLAKIYKVLLIFLYSLSVARTLHTSLIRASKYVKADKELRNEIESKVKLRFPNEDSDDPEYK